MRETTTAGAGTLFQYEGSTSGDIRLLLKSTKVIIPKKLIQAILTKFKNKAVVGGFSVTSPPVDGLGYYIQEYSKSNLERSLSPRFASHLSAIFRDEGLATLTKKGNKIIIRFI